MNKKERARLERLAGDIKGAANHWRSESRRNPARDMNTTKDYCQGRADAYENVWSSLMGFLEREKEE